MTIAVPGRLTRPGEDQVGELIVATWRCLRAAPLRYLGLGIVPALLGTGAVLSPLALPWLLAPGRLTGSSAGLLGAGVVAVSVLGVALNLAFLARIVALTRAIAAGTLPSSSQVGADTRGFLGRSAGLILLATGLVMLLGTGIEWASGLWLIVDGQPRVIPLVALAVGLVGLWTLIGARCYAVLPVLALDTGRSGFSSLAEAWRQTSGQYGRTLSWVVLLGAQIWLGRTLAALPLMMLLAGSNPRGDLGAQLAAGWFSIAISAVLLPAFSLASVVFSTAAQTLFCADLAERRPAAPTLNWAPPTSGPVGGIQGGGWRPSALSGPRPPRS